eukprot:5517292-Alexandrium_andersonii.AAC.1
MWAGPPAAPPEEAEGSDLPMAPSLWPLRRRPPRGAFLGWGLGRWRAARGPRSRAQLRWQYG